MKPVKRIVRTTKKIFEKRNFLNSLPSEAIKDLEKGLYDKLSNFKYSIKELLEMEDYELLIILKSKRLVENLFVFLQKEIKERGLDIDLKKYPAFKNFEVKRKDKLNYVK